MIDPTLITWLVSTFGYLGVFLSSLIGSASIFLPVPSFLLVIAAGSSLNPAAVGLFAGIGAAIGELTGYAIGRGIVYGKDRLQKGKKIISKDMPLTKKIKKWIEGKYGPVFIFIFAASPLPDDIVGVVCGMLRYDVKRYFLASLAGKIVLHLVLAFAGYYGFEFLFNLIWP